MRTLVLLLLASMSATTEKTLSEFAEQYREKPDIQRYTVWAERYRSDKPQTGTEWEFIDGWYVKPVTMKKTITTVIEYIDGICVGREITTVMKQEYGESHKAHPEHQYWVPPATKQPVTIDDLIKDSLADPNGFPVEFLYKLKELGR